MRRIFRLHRLQQKLSLYAFVIALLALGAVSSLTYIVARKPMQEDREWLMELFARQIADELSDALDHTADELRHWTELVATLKPFQPGGEEQFRSEFDRWAHATLAEEPEAKYDLIVVLDTRGHIYALNKESSKGYPLDVEPLLGQHYTYLFPEDNSGRLIEVLGECELVGLGWEKYHKVNEVYGRIGPPQTKAAVPGYYQIVMARPLKYLKERGALVLVICWARFQKVLDHAESELNRRGLSTGYGYLLDRDADTIIGHKYRDPQDPDEGKRNLYGTSLTKNHHLPELQKRASENPHGTIPYRWREGGKIAALTKVLPLTKGDLPFDWRVGVGINEPDIFAPVYELLYKVLAIFLVVALSVVLLNSALGRMVSVSLNELAQIARDAAQGRFYKTIQARSDDEVGQLAQAFNEMLVSFREKIPFTPIPNPYVVGNPIRNPAMFFGRKEDLEWIGNQLGSSGNKIILLYGPRRIGKTSLLHQIGSGRATPQTLSFFFDTQQIIPELERDADFYHVLTREMLAQLPTVLPGSGPPFIAADYYTPETLRRLLKFLHRSAPGKHPVLLFDELENLEFKFIRGALSTDVLFFLGGLLDGEIPVSFVATGSDKLEKLSPYWHVLLPKTTPRRIGLLTENDARRLILEPVQGSVLYDDGIPDRILRLTAGHPYYTQVICQTLVDYLNHKQASRVGNVQLAEAVDLVLNHPPPPLNHVWETLPTQGKLAAAGLAHVLTDEDHYASPEAIRDGMPAELRVHVDPVSFRSAMDTLDDENWLEKSKGSAYRFQVDLLRRWIVREHSVWQVADELQGGSK